ncbi:hypothetical protein SAMN04487820_101240 [Actinopolyspora mzabensis]|uniref:Uncharacterized protein n=1 Tax=Actinopolyspora mzabensis TaxID=995066 RepID=A0A1G8VPL6_ACTMZ|nr:hypothetical protein SAMN04487820_101240 [Actinopolyspora mzabensis]
MTARAGWPFRSGSVKTRNVGQRKVRTKLMTSELPRDVLGRAEEAAGIG